MSFILWNITDVDTKGFVCFVSLITFLDQKEKKKIAQTQKQTKKSDLIIKSQRLRLSSLNGGKQCLESFSNLPKVTQKAYYFMLLSAAKSLQCPTLCDPIDVSPPGSPIPGILQARTLEWVAISFSNAWKWKVKVKLLSPVRLLATPWTAAYQTPPSMGFSRQEYWSGVPLPSPW